MINSNFVLQFDILTISVFFPVLQLIALAYNTARARCETRRTTRASLQQQQGHQVREGSMPLRAPVSIPHHTRGACKKPTSHSMMELSRSLSLRAGGRQQAARLRSSSRCLSASPELRGKLDNPGGLSWLWKPCFPHMLAPSPCELLSPHPCQPRSLQGDRQVWPAQVRHRICSEKCCQGGTFSV